MASGRAAANGRSSLFLMFQMLDIILLSLSLRFEIRMHHNQCDHHNKAAVLEMMHLQEENGKATEALSKSSE